MNVPEEMYFGYVDEEKSSTEDGYADDNRPVHQIHATDDDGEAQHLG